MVVDMNGKEIKKGQTVRVHQEEEISIAKAIHPFEDDPTLNKSGHWVDIDKGDGVEGMMSYILEVVR